MSNEQMNEESLRKKISRIRKGAKVSVIPYSIEAGDPFTSIGIPCTMPTRSVVELKAPFLAHLENFDGEIVWLRTQSYYCLKVPVGDLRDVTVLISSSWERQSPHN